MSSTSCNRSSDECNRWLRHVSHVQLERLTPEMRQAVVERSERRRTTESLRRRSTTMASHSFRSQHLLSEGLQQLSISGSALERSAAQARWSSALESSVTWTNRTMTSLDIDIATQGEAARPWREDEVMAEGDQEAAMLMSSGQAPPARDEVKAGSSDLEKLLCQLRQEPTEEEDMAAKFRMYETYGQEVERMREQVFAFHEEHLATLPPAVSVEMSKQLKTIDSADAMAIPEDTQDWFVYHMMKQAEKNNRALSNVLEGFGKKLELLAKSDQAECPICLETFDSSRKAETLGCCHCVCSDCWENWSAVMHGRPFCPLCRHEAFIDMVASRNASHTASRSMQPPAGPSFPMQTSIVRRFISSCIQWLPGCRSTLY
eukprot:TRINITY_DN82174_c0_g1_i1.p1 TRINITY_DN82174_c0_g1~~TRINITY_DN82174_c0_g1_i1.p1  ORF type:complete len:375 (-),score=76.91 TRINITY_DN82174_c0_g1_i1:96-1220(-)